MIEFWYSKILNGYKLFLNQHITHPGRLELVTDSQKELQFNVFVLYALQICHFQMIVKST